MAKRTKYFVTYTGGQNIGMERVWVSTPEAEDKMLAEMKECGEVMEEYERRVIYNNVMVVNLRVHTEVEA